MVIGLYTMDGKTKQPLGAVPVALSSELSVLQQFTINSCLTEFAAIMAEETGWPISADVLSTTQFPCKWDDNRFLRIYTVLDKTFNVEFVLNEKEKVRYWNELASNGLFAGSVLRCNTHYDSSPNKPCERFGLIWAAIESDQNGKQYAIVIDPQLLRESIQISAFGKTKLFQHNMAATTRALRAIAKTDIKHVTLI